MVGVTTGTLVLGKSIADPSFDAFFAELNRRKAVLFIHPLGGSLGSPWIESSKLVWAVGAPLEDTVCMLHFMQADFPSRFPDIKIILPHLGGFAPFLAERLDQQKGSFLSDKATAPSVQAKYFWYDTVNASPSALRCTIESPHGQRVPQAAAIRAALDAAAAVAPVVMPYFKNLAINMPRLTVSFAFSHRKQCVENCHCNGAAALASAGDNEGHG